jgi:hypothetical protein
MIENENNKNNNNNSTTNDTRESKLFNYNILEKSLLDKLDKYLHEMEEIKLELANTQSEISKAQLNIMAMNTIQNNSTIVACTFFTDPSFYSIRQLLATIAILLLDAKTNEDMQWINMISHFTNEEKLNTLKTNLKKFDHNRHYQTPIPPNINRIYSCISSLMENSSKAFDCNIVQNKNPYFTPLCQWVVAIMLFYKQHNHMLKIQENLQKIKEECHNNINSQSNYTQINQINSSSVYSDNHHYLRHQLKDCLIETHLELKLSKSTRSKSNLFIPIKLHYIKNNNNNNDDVIKFKFEINLDFLTVIIESMKNSNDYSSLQLLEKEFINSMQPYLMKLSFFNDNANILITPGVENLPLTIANLLMSLNDSKIYSDYLTNDESIENLLVKFRSDIFSSLLSKYDLDSYSLILLFEKIIKAKNTAIDLKTFDRFAQKLIEFQKIKNSDPKSFKSYHSAFISFANKIENKIALQWLNENVNLFII